MNAIKYPRTYHLPFSEGRSSDDKILKSLEHLEGEEIVLTEKMDGENTSLYPDRMHARSLDSQHNYTRDWVKRMHSVICHEIPAGWRFCGENLAYYHSIHYKDLDSFFYLLSIWNEDNVCVSWDDTVQWAWLLDLAQPKVFYRGVFSIDEMLKLKDSLDPEKVEGFVGRFTRSFPYNEYGKNVFKYVRAGHVNAGAEHWLKTTYPNELRKDGTIKPTFME